MIDQSWHSFSQMAKGSTSSHSKPNCFLWLPWVLLGCRMPFASLPRLSCNCGAAKKHLSAGRKPLLTMIDYITILNHYKRSLSVGVPPNGSLMICPAQNGQPAGCVRENPDQAVDTGEKQPDPSISEPSFSIQSWCQYESCYNQSDF